MDTQNFRVDDKRNVHYNGRKTAFKLFRRDGDRFLFSGEYTARGWNASDERCISEAHAKMDAAE